MLLMQYLGQAWQLNQLTQPSGRRFHFHKEEIPNGNEEESKETSQEKEVVMGSGEAKASLIFCEATLASAIAVRGGLFRFVAALATIHAAVVPRGGSCYKSAVEQCCAEITDMRARRSLARAARSTSGARPVAVVRFSGAGDEC